MWLFLAIECRRGKPPYPVALLDEVPDRNRDDGFRARV